MENINYNEGDIVIRADFATLADDGKTVLKRYAWQDLSLEERGAITKDINYKVALSGATFEVRDIQGKECILIVYGIRLRLRDKKEIDDVLNEFSCKANKVLKDSAVNIKRLSENKLPLNAVIFNRQK